MPEKIAVVGPREGADLEAVDGFIDTLWEGQPDSIVLSGGAAGVDSRAESGWLAKGGTVWSYRIKKKGDELYVVEKWEMGPEGSRIFELIREPSWRDPVSALFYRSMLVAEECDRCVAFYGHGHQRGTEFTVEIAENEINAKPTYIFQRDS